MNWIEAMKKIFEKNFIICEDETEISGEHPSICVYNKEGMFAGKLRWNKKPPMLIADEELIGELENANRT